MKPRPEDKPVLIALVKNGSRWGDSLSELADATGYSVQRLAAVAKRYDGEQMGRFRLDYLPPDNGSFREACPGIKNPRNGICQRIPAQISVTYRRKKK